MSKTTDLVIDGMNAEKKAEPKIMECPKCHGSGDLEVTCYNCDGTGFDDDVDETCFTCEGRGYESDECDRCDGAGKVER